MTKELEPCPFCGGEARHDLMMDGMFSFVCFTCGANVRFAEDQYPDDYMKQKAIEKWNARAEKSCKQTKEDGECVWLRY